MSYYQQQPPQQQQQQPYYQQQQPPQQYGAPANQKNTYTADGKPIAQQQKDYYYAQNQEYAQPLNSNPDEVYVQGIPLYAGDGVPASASRFVVTGYRDVWALVLFVLAVVATAGFAVFNIKDIKDKGLSDTQRDTVNTLKLWLPISAFVTFLLSSVVLIAMRAFARQFIIVANVFMVLLTAAVAVYAFSRKLIWMGALFAICAVLHALWLYLVRRRIPLATVLLSTSSRLAFRYRGTLLVSFLCLVAGLVYVCLWALMAYPVARNFNENEQHASTWNFPAGVGLLLLLLWASQVCCNVAHVTASGVVATWYFCGDNNVPPNPSLASVKRAMSTSFGSICFGSLMVAIVKLIYYLVRMAEQQARNDFALCMLRCIVGIIERLFEWFNVYAFTHIAIYGSSYIEAAKQTWNMIKECGWAAYFNDCLVWPVLSLTCFVTSAAVGVGFGLASWDVLVGVVCFIVAYVIMVIQLRPVYSGIVAQFVCIAECPAVMQTNNLEYFQAIEAATQALNQPAC